ncbi:histidine kinase N-terminal 7TM domain-containing protein [Halogeometricum limi]|uniref:PAS domain S-box-containing protein n=1 Tax=Halogeometricum limi TaxID=555875 RepID=A0A1I6GPB9_9EURY|nr:histidine kinase N-terminal 7TM domain-containing protein [Halogeometricum limi]SFR44008.1 PAS domain S-box-containing protein [Halogeometricum limi]
MIRTTIGLSLVAGALCASVTVVVLLRYNFYSRRVRVPFAVLSLVCAVWATAYGFKLMAPTRTGSLLWYQLTWVGAAFAPTAWFVFALAYAGDRTTLTRRNIAALCVEPVLVVLLVVTGVAGTNDLFVAGFDHVTVGSWSYVVAAQGPLYDVHLLYVTTLALVGAVVMGRLLVRGDGTYRRGTLVLLAAAALPLLGFAVDLLGRSPTELQSVPPALGLSALVVLFGLQSDELFDVTPVARDLVLTEIRDGIVVLDDRARVVELNPAARPLFTVPRSSAVGSHVADVCHNSLGMYALLDGDRDRLDLKIEDDDERRYYEATATPIGGTEGHDRGWTVVLRDTTERRRTEAKFRALIENSRDLITVLDAEGTRTYASPSSEQVLGVPRERLEGNGALDRIHPDDYEAVASTFEEGIATSDAVRAEFRTKHADGTWRTLDAVAVNLLDDPAVGGVVVNSRDVTERRRYEQRLRVLNRILRHDLRNDMNVILGHTELLADRLDDPDEMAHVETIRRKARSLVSLGERARQIDKTLHSDERERVPVEITDLLRDRLAAVRDENPSIVLDTYLPEEAWVLATNQVGTAVTNVVDNALEHNDRVLPRVGVSVTTRPADDEVEVRVVDNGPGIPPSELAALESGTETQLQHASGLGLWLVKWILSVSNGSISFEERDGRGTAVVMRFECASAPADSARDGDEELARSDD